MAAARAAATPTSGGDQPFAITKVTPSGAPAGLPSTRRAAWAAVSTRSAPVSRDTLAPVPATIASNTPALIAAVPPTRITRATS